VLEETYGVVLPPPPEGQPEDTPPTGDEMLNAYAFQRGFMTSSGLPDQSRAARIILTDYVAGKLIYCHPPPGVDAQSFQVKRFRKPIPQNKDSTTETTTAATTTTEKTEKKKPTYLANATRSAGDEQYYDYLNKQDKVTARTSRGKKESTHAFTRQKQVYYTPIPVAQLQKDARAMKLLYGDGENKE